MDVFEAIRTRLTVREFLPDAVPDEVLDRIVEAARLAPSSRNLQPWHFVVVTDSATLSQIGAIASSGRFVGNAPAAVAVTMDGADRPDLDAGRAIQQMELMAWSEGLGTCFVGLRDETQNAEIKALLGIPAEFQLITVLPFGYRQRVTAGAKGRKNRKPLSEVAHRERFGEPYA